MDTRWWSLEDARAAVDYIAPHRRELVHLVEVRQVGRRLVTVANQP